MKRLNKYFYKFILDKTLEKKDFLVELNELIIEIHKEIHDTNKDKHNRWVDV